MSIAHRQEVLDAHMNHSNWKKMVHMVPSILKRWKRMEVGMDLSADTFNSLTKCLKKHTKRWLKSERNAQLNRSSDSTVMDIYDTVTKLILEESGDPTTRGQTSWIASGIRIQELQLAIKYQLRTSGTNIITDATIHSSLHIAMSEIPPSPIWAHMMYPEHSSHSMDHPSSLASDGSGMDSPNSEDLPILLPSSLGWNWCVTHDVQSLAAKEARLHISQANESIHRICLALGFKSALFQTQVRSANTQQTKTRAWTAISSVDTTVHEHARIYSMARDAFWNIRLAHPDALELLTLTPQDLHVATLVLGSDKPAQGNTQQSWIWSFGQTCEDEGTWMDDFERVHWLHAKAQFQHCWKNSRAFMMKHNGFLLISMPRQRHGRNSWSLL
ncbi:hypothetical protein EI94DRAFT_1799088 [Lactarius quietus]|nr:hypothetical protein EI94DRAFT_1799088 [Lactarius quietus]